MGGSQEATGRRNQKATGRRSQEIGRERSSGEEGGGQALRGESFQEGSQSHQAQGTQGREIQRGGEEGKEQEREEQHQKGKAGSQEGQEHQENQIFFQEGQINRGKEHGREECSRHPTTHHLGRRGEE